MLLTALGAERNARIYSGKRQGRKKSGEFSPLFPENVKCRKYVRWPGKLSPFPPLQTRAAAIREERGGRRRRRSNIPPPREEGLDEASPNIGDAIYKVSPKRPVKIISRRVPPPPSSSSSFSPATQVGEGGYLNVKVAPPPLPPPPTSA